MDLIELVSDVGGIYTFHDGTTTTEAEAPTGLFEDVGGCVDIDNAGNLAFQGQASGGLERVFLGPDPVEDKLIAEGDELFGSAVASVRLAGMNNRNQIAFNYTLTNGVRGVAIATVPEPAGGTLLVIGLVAAVIHRRRGRRTDRSRRRG